VVKLSRPTEEGEEEVEATTVTQRRSREEEDPQRDRAVPLLHDGVTLSLVGKAAIAAEQITEGEGSAAPDHRSPQGRSESRISMLLALNL
jgi:hypothetical protein